MHSSDSLTLGQMVVLTETQFMVSALPVEGMQTRQMTSRVLERALFETPHLGPWVGSLVQRAELCEVVDVCQAFSDVFRGCG